MEPVQQMSGNLLSNSILGLPTLLSVHSSSSFETYLKITSPEPYTRNISQSYLVILTQAAPYLLTLLVILCHNKVFLSFIFYEHFSS